MHLISVIMQFFALKSKMSSCCRSKPYIAVTCSAKWRYCKPLCVSEILDCSRSWKAYYFKCKQTQMAWMCHQLAWALKQLVLFLSRVLYVFLSLAMYFLLSLALSSDLHLRASGGTNRVQSHVSVPMVSAQGGVSPLNALEASPCSNFFLCFK